MSESEQPQRVLIIKAHPRADSLCNALAAEYAKGAESNDAEVRTLSLPHMDLAPWLTFDWSANHDSIPTSADLQNARELIRWSAHLLFAYPIYWAAPPALLKLFLEVIIVSGFAFKFHHRKFGVIPQWDKLLSGRSASLLCTLDGPPLAYELYDHDPSGRMMKDIFRATGIDFKHKFYFGPVQGSDAEKREKWLRQARDDGQKDTQRGTAGSTPALEDPC